MKRIIVIFPILALLVFVTCGKKGPIESPRFSSENEMIELYNPTKDDTFSWVLVTGNASIMQGVFPLELQSTMGEIFDRRSVTLAGKAPDTFEFAMGVPVKEDVAPQKARIRAYSQTAENSGSMDAAMVSCYIIPGSGPAHGTIISYYAALDTNDFKAAYDYIVAEGQAYPNLSGGEAVFSPRPKLSIFKTWKKEEERIRVLSLRPETTYDLPADGLFCYRAKVEHKMGEETKVEQYYVFLKRQPDGFFKLYKPRKDPHKAD
jgi:predicted small lipoprotein YifL